MTALIIAGYIIAGALVLIVAILAALYVHYKRHPFSERNTIGHAQARMPQNDEPIPFGLTPAGLLWNEMVRNNREFDQAVDQRTGGES